VPWRPAGSGRQEPSGRRFDNVGAIVRVETKAIQDHFGSRLDQFDIMSNRTAGEARQLDLDDLRSDLLARVLFRRHLSDLHRDRITILGHCTPRGRSRSAPLSARSSVCESSTVMLPMSRRSVACAQARRCWSAADLSHFSLRAAVQFPQNIPANNTASPRMRSYRLLMGDYLLRILLLLHQPRGRAHDAASRRCRTNS
jgi:hypothetical protein